MKYGNYLTKLVAEQKRGIPRGIYSVCSHNRYVVEAAMQQAMDDRTVLLIESTCNQVNQFGGYTGMKPGDFKKYILTIARSVGFPSDRILLGGDHLGPYPFKAEKADSAMEKARDMVRQYVSVGCIKIHLDASDRLNDDPGGKDSALDPGVIAERCADLCAVAEKTIEDLKSEVEETAPPVYVIGTEVPAPGGSDEVEQGLRVTKVSDFKITVSMTEEAFHRHNLGDAWHRVMAVVVQPGVEHGDHTIVEYDRKKAQGLKAALRDYPDLVFEGHATDYQKARGLKEMVEDGIAILKVGPALTFAAREAIFLLSYMEDEIFSGKREIRLSRFREILDESMMENPLHWQKHYIGDELEVAFARKFSFFDRARYYWVDKKVQSSLALLMTNLRSVEIPLSLISQFFPEQYRKVRNGELDRDPENFIRDRIREVLKTYAYAVGDIQSLPSIR
jgi:D-tagatose-1,6-bisphosphate aldolase subunit GatZ/KbaZ